MKELTLIYLIVFIGCTNQNSRPEVNKHKENIQINLVPAHFLKGQAIPKSIPQMMAENSIPGVSIAFIDNGKISWLKTFGFSNLEDSTKVSPNTVFNGASLSKPVTAMAALKLVDKGTLALNENVNTRLKGWRIPESHFTEKEKVTLKRLISHTAGIDNHLWSCYAPDEEVPTLEQMLSGENPSVDPPVVVVYQPGEKRKYSNPGYSIIEKLIQDVTGQDFETALDELIFSLCDMNNSSFEQPVPDKMKKQMATGYSNDLQPYPYKLFPFRAAGGIWTTPAELGKFLMTLLEDYHTGQNIILSKKMADSVFQKSTERLGFTKLYNDESQDILFEHWGSNSGFTSYMVASLNKKQGVVIMTNSDNGTNLMSFIARAVANEYEWDFLKSNVFKSIEMTYDEMNQFVGKFKGGSEIMEFGVDGDKFTYSDVRNNNSELIPIAESKFILPYNNILYEFLRDKNNNVKYVRVTTAEGFNNDYLKQ